MQEQMRGRCFAAQKELSTAKSSHAIFLKSWGQEHSIGWRHFLRSLELPFWRRGFVYSFHHLESLYRTISSPAGFAARTELSRASSW
jgi:hypothetical protein